MTLAHWRGSRAVRLLFWAAAVFTFVMAEVPHPPPVPGNPNDKVQHVMAFAALAVVGSFAYPETAVGHLLLRLSLFGAVIELVQAIPVLHRDCDPKDWLADTIAAAVVLSVVWLWRRRSQESKP